MLRNRHGSHEFQLGRLLEFVTVLMIALSVGGLVTMRLGIFDATPIWLIAVLTACAYSAVNTSWASGPPGRVPTWHIVLLLTVGLLFRLYPYVWILGGQDQGVYVNMAMELVRTGGLEPTDSVSAWLTDPLLNEIYREDNYGSVFLPGVYQTGAGLVFQFYHLFPVWLALFGVGTEASAAVYGLTFLSVLSLLYFYRLAHLLTGSATTALVAGVLLAVNPLHAFFSKFPVTEIPTLTFSLMAFGLLIECWRTESDKRRWTTALLSAVAMGLLFMTRISGFEYIPIIYAISLAVVLFEPDTGKKRALLCWCIVVAVLYGLSVLYGLKWSGPYSRDIYELAFAPLFGANWKFAVGGAIGILLVGWVSVFYFSRRPLVADRMRKVMEFGVKTLPTISLLFLVVALYKAYQLGFTDTFADGTWSGSRWALSGAGMRAVFSVSLIVAAIYLSPPVWLAFFVAPFTARYRAPLQLLLLFTTCFAGHFALLQWYIPYQPYYARYLISELVPYALLLVVVLWHTTTKRLSRWGLGAALLLGAFWSFGLTMQQVSQQEHGGVAESMDQILSNVGPGDVVLLNLPLAGDLGNQLATPIKFVYGLPVVRGSTSSFSNVKYMSALAQQYDDVYMLTDRNISLPGFQERNSVRFIQERYRHGSAPPVGAERMRYVKVNIYEYRPEQQFGFTPDAKYGVNFLDGWSGQEGWGVWTAGLSAGLQLDMTKVQQGACATAIEIHGRAYVSSEQPAQRLQLYLNGRLLEDRTVTLPQREITFHLPVSLMREQLLANITLRTPQALSPASLGRSRDQRLLAFGLEQIQVVGCDR